MSKPHRCPHIAMTGNICVCALWHLEKLSPALRLTPKLIPAQLLPGRTRLGFRVLDPVLHGACAVNAPRSDELQLKTSGAHTQGYEPTSMRAIRARYDPYEQSKGRVEQLRSLGHSVDKVRFLLWRLHRRLHSEVD